MLSAIARFQEDLQPPDVSTTSGPAAGSPVNRAPTYGFSLSDPTVSRYLCKLDGDLNILSGYSKVDYDHHPPLLGSRTGAGRDWQAEPSLRGKSPRASSPALTGG